MSVKTPGQTASQESRYPDCSPSFPCIACYFGKPLHLTGLRQAPNLQNEEIELNDRENCFILSGSVIVFIVLMFKYNSEKTMV